jgi:hypothetical protein
VGRFANADGIADCDTPATPDLTKLATVTVMPQEQVVWLPTIEVRKMRIELVANVEINRMNPFRSNTIAMILVGLVCTDPRSVATAGEPNAPACVSPGYDAYQANEAQHKSCWCRCLDSLPSAPAVPVVPTIPAVMLAQPAVPVSPQLMTQAIRQQLTRDQSEQLVERLQAMLTEAGIGVEEAPADVAPAAAVQANVDQSAEIEHLREQVRELQQSVLGLRDALERTSSQLERLNRPSN